MTTTLRASQHRAAAPVRYWPLVAAATVMLLVTMGIRQSLGLFVQPLAHDTGLAIQTISFALAVGQFVWGAVQPAFGALADSKGSGRAAAIALDSTPAPSDSVVQGGASSSTGGSA